MLTHNLHAHTFRCNHATGTEREYIENAIRGGMRVYGFSDHSPYVFEGDYYSGFRMKPDMLDGYVKTISALRDEYKTISRFTSASRRNTIRGFLMRFSA